MRDHSFPGFCIDTLYKIFEVPAGVKDLLVELCVLRASATSLYVPRYMHDQYMSLDFPAIEYIRQLNC